MSEVVTISGLAELRQTLLRDLPEALQGKASQVALSKAAQPMLNEARARAPSRAPRDFVGPIQPGKAKGNLKRSIYAYRNRESTRTYESRFIGVRQKAFYWRFIEFGRGEINKDKGSLGNEQHGFFGKSVKAVPAKPFLRPAFEANKFKAIGIYAEALKPAIQVVSLKAQRRTIKRFIHGLTGF